MLNFFVQPQPLWLATELESEKLLNWLILILFGIAVIALLVFVIKRNQKDKKEFEHQLNEDFYKSKDEEGDIDSEEKMK